MYGEEDLFRKNKIKIAPLKISTKTPGNDRLGHFHYRYDMVEFYNQNSEGIISYSELFTKAKSFAELNSENCSTPEARVRYILSKGNMVFVSGQAGIGKTTFTKLLVKEMLDPDIRLYKAEVVFFLRFRDVNYKKETDLLQFLTTGFSIKKHYNEEKREKILEKLDECENLYIVMDGLDEAIISTKVHLPPCDIDSQETAEVFIINLLRGNILPRSKKIVTSRPRQLTSLPEECKSKFVVNIQGLYDEGQEQICRNLCGDDAVRHNLIIGEIKRRPDLKSYCHVPINCILIILSFIEMDETEWKNVASLTSILVTALDEWFIKKLKKGEFQIQEISELAYKGFVESRYYFYELDLKMAGVDTNNMTTFLTNNFKFKLLNGSEIVSYFAHLMWQELFVAVKIRLYFSTKDFQKLILGSDLLSEKFEVVTRFLFGLCNEKTERKLFVHADAKTLSSSMNSKEFRKMLKEFTLKLLEKDFKNTSSSPVSKNEEDDGEENLDFTADVVSTDNQDNIDDAVVFQHDDGSSNVCESNCVAASDIVTIRSDEIVTDADFQPSFHNAIDCNDVTDENNFDTLSTKIKEQDCKANIIHDQLDGNHAGDADDHKKSDDTKKKIRNEEDDVNNDNDGKVYINKDDRTYFSNLLPILQWVFEMRDEDFTKQVATCLRNEIIIYESQILPTEIPSFNYVLRARQAELIVKLVYPSFIGECAEYFIKELDTTLMQNSNIQVSAFF